MRRAGESDKHLVGVHHAQEEWDHQDVVEVLQLEEAINCDLGIETTVDHVKVYQEV